MRDTAPRQAIERRATDELLDDLCLALRDVGVRDYCLPDDESVTSFIKEVQLISSELKQRNTDFKNWIERLSDETGWQMEQLLQECLLYPEVIPYVRERDGVRRVFRCSICGKRERPNLDGICLCDECLSEAIESIRRRKPSKGLILFRTYNETKRCKHADSETVLMAFDDEYDFQMENSYCEQCLIEEQRRRMDWLRAQDSRDILLRQAGALRDDPYLDELLAAIYRDRKQSEETN